MLLQESNLRKEKLPHILKLLSTVTSNIYEAVCISTCPMIYKYKCKGKIFMFL